MDPITRISHLIAAGAWIDLHTPTGGISKIAAGAAEWVGGRGLIFAEIGAEHQGHVHLVEAARLDLDGHMVDAYAAAGRLVATVHDMSPDEAAAHNVVAWHRRIDGDTPTGAAWRRFWAQEVATHSG